jgi:importin subunit alpha-6/7
VLNTSILVEALPSLITSTSASIVRKSCWLVSNVLAGTHTQIQAVIDAGLVKPIFESLSHDDNRVRFEASGALTNLILGG